MLSKLVVAFYKDHACRECHAVIASSCHLLLYRLCIYMCILCCKKKTFQWHAVLSWTTNFFSSNKMFTWSVQQRFYSIFKCFKTF